MTMGQDVLTGNVPVAASDADAATMLRQLETMRLIRAYEERLVELQRGGAPGTCTSVGQEACAVGVIDALDDRDHILTNHRSAGHLLARGADPGRLMAEVLGRVDGYCGGRAGSLHISAVELGVVLTSTIVGAELSMAPGVALAQKLGRGAAGGIVTVFFGDGAACEGIFHESVNLAVQWQLPILFVCEDNHWQAYVHRRETMPDGAIERWAQGHGVASQVVDGNDLEAVHRAALEAVAGVRASGRPRFLTLVTYRQRGHLEPDEQGYVDPDERADWLARDPIRLAEERLRERGVMDSATLTELEQRVAARIAQASAFAESSPRPAADTLLDHIYA